ncbi:hypothetical protein FQZ97_843700 [compost metagenome]
MIFLGFCTEPGDQVMGNAAIVADDLPDTVFFPQVPLPVVGTVHQLQYPGASALCRQVDIIADVLIFFDGIKHFICNIFRVRSRKPDPQVRTDQGHFFQQLRKIKSFLFFLPVIGIHVLPQEGHFTVPLFKKLAGFFLHGMRITAALPATGIGHHTETAHIVAPPHNGYKRRDAV